MGFMLLRAFCGQRAKLTRGAMSAVEKPGFRKDLEGLRAIAILLVIVYHAGVPGFGGGFIGVDVFFVLSGYLITNLLVRDSKRPGGIDFVAFYARRARRLLPASAVVVLACLVAGRALYSPGELRSLAAVAVATSLYLSNSTFIRTGTQYLEPSVDLSALLHTWSLAVEEQFYVLWPLLVWLAWRRTAAGPPARRTLLVLGAVAIVSFAACLWLTEWAQAWAFFSSPTRAWEFAAGALAGQVPLRPMRPSLRHGLGGLGLALVFGAALLFDESTVFPGLAALAPVVGVVLLLRALQVAPSQGWGRILGLGVFQTLGRLSYGWYLWHWPVLVFGRVLGLVHDAASGLLASLLALGLAWVTYHLVENPARHARWLVENDRRSLLAAGAVTLAMAAITFGVRSYAMTQAERPDMQAISRAESEKSGLYARDCMLDYFALAPAAHCSFGDLSSSQTVVLFGDSHAAHWFPAIERLARERHWRLEVFTKSECPAASVDIKVRKLQRTYHECATWREAALQRIRALRPRAVFLSNSSGYVTTGAPVAFAVTATEWRSGLTRTLTALAAGGGQTILLRDTPLPVVSIPQCLARQVWPWHKRKTGCDTPRDSAFRPAIWQAETQAAQGLAGVHSVDLTDAICGPELCLATRDGRPTYADGNHLAVAFAESLAPALARAVAPLGL